MKKTLSRLFSMPATGLLLVIFAISIGYATFIENNQGTTTAKILVYDSWWFVALLAILVINLSGSIIVNKMIAGKKWSMLLFHLSFIVILAGAAVTRYVGTEGVIHIREGGASDRFISDETFVTIAVDNGQESFSEMKRVRFAAQTKNRFKESITINDQTVTVENIRFIPSASRSVVADESGGPVLSLVAIGKQKQRLEFILTKGEERNLNNTVFSFGNPTDETTILFRERGDGVVLTAMNGELSAGTMGSEMTRLPNLEEFPLQEKRVYQIGHISFILKQYLPKGRTRLVANSSAEMAPGDAMEVRISVGEQSEIIDLFGSKGLPGQPGSVTIDGINVAVTYGAVLKRLPFSLYLNDFQLERYPGSNSPSSFASEVTIIDKLENREFPFRIFMNNILKYKGYRFFQSSYDKDEQGTVLSVNYDSWGTAITYIGYLMMTIGMLFTLFNHRSRFQMLIRALSKLKSQRVLPLILLFMLAVHSHSGAQAPTTFGRIDRAHARSFGELLVQSNEGRIEPVTSMASKILRKIYRKSSFEGLTPVEVFLGMNADAGSWRGKQIIRVSDPGIKMMLGISGDYVSFDQVMSGGYKLKNLVEEAYGKPPALRSRSDKEVIKIDERVNICYLALSGGFLKIFPIPDDANHTWTVLGGAEGALPAENREWAIRVLSNYMTMVNQAKQTGSWSPAEELLNELKQNQLTLGYAVIPAKAKIKLEVFYVNHNIFSKLAKGYLVTGLILLALAFFNIFKPAVKIRRVTQVGVVLVFVLFILHSSGLAIRWYIAGHAPWSNGYESMIFIGWATCLSGLVFARRSQMALAVTTVLSAIILLIAGLSWMSPEITNLVPVLKSYWLIVHVAIVTASYGFLGIGSLLGLTNLILIIVRDKKSEQRVTLTIEELSYIIEISLIVGLFMLTIGSFIGGVWANESWGRYWGWDPKETWALVTILVYSFIVHMHRIPGFKGHFQLSTAALVGFGSVLMTYFGVNYYFSGLHSYASGEAAPVPKGVYVAIVVLLIVILSAYFSKKKTRQK
ncbi:MAG: cytochrome c biogenesis protein CcsA [Bacteroidota bacterium]